MIKLIISRIDSSIYWTEYFNDVNACDRWLSAEKTRPYWDSSYSMSIEDDSINGFVLTDGSILNRKDDNKAAVGLLDNINESYWQDFLKA